MTTTTWLTISKDDILWENKSFLTYRNGIIFTNFTFNAQIVSDANNRSVVWKYEEYDAGFSKITNITGVTIEDIGKLKKYNSIAELDNINTTNGFFYDNDGGATGGVPNIEKVLYIKIPMLYYFGIYNKNKYYQENIEKTGYADNVVKDIHNIQLNNFYDPIIDGVSKLTQSVNNISTSTISNQELKVVVANKEGLKDTGISTSYLTGKEATYCYTKNDNIISNNENIFYKGNIKSVDVSNLEIKYTLADNGSFLFSEMCPHITEEKTDPLQKGEFIFPIDTYPTTIVSYGDIVPVTLGAVRGSKPLLFYKNANIFRFLTHDYTIGSGYMSIHKIYYSDDEDTALTYTMGSSTNSMGRDYTYIEIDTTERDKINNIVIDGVEGVTKDQSLNGTIPAFTGTKPHNPIEIIRKIIVSRGDKVYADDFDITDWNKSIADNNSIVAGIHSHKNISILEGAIEPLLLTSKTLDIINITTEGKVYIKQRTDLSTTPLLNLDSTNILKKTGVSRDTTNLYYNIKLTVENITGEKVIVNDEVNTLYKISKTLSRKPSIVYRNSIVSGAQESLQEIADALSLYTKTPYKTATITVPMQTEGLLKLKLLDCIGVSFSSSYDTNYINCNILKIVYNINKRIVELKVRLQN